MNSYSVNEIARITKSRLCGEPGRIIRHFCTDTRRIDFPAECLFVALKGPSHDGQRFLNEAYASGIRSFLVRKLPDNRADFSGSSFIVADDTLKALQDVATWHRLQFKGRMIAVTGSNGKTIVKEWLSQLLQASFQVIKSPKSYNSQLGVPLSVLNISGEEQFAILEAGISQPGEMNSLRQILNPDMGIITNIGDAHQENFTDLASKAREKISLFQNCRDIFYCLDHELIHHEIEKASLPAIKHTWSRKHEASLIITGEQIDHASCHLSGLFGNQPVTLTIPFTDPASVENLIQIWLFMLVIQFDQSLLQTQVLNLEPIRMRLEQKAGINRCTLINDYYNSDILSFKIALDLLFQQTHQRRKTIILS
ncbi:MAG: Mur ligase family protein, partial [Bacteroidales bacterium]|nr:Mur ligase family protein [Bacteroidales bacterium]